MIKSLVLFFSISFAMAPLHAQESPYSGWEGREIKALSDNQVRGYLSGKGMGLALPAELNGYPGPKHVLELESRLELSVEQREAVERVFRQMHESAVALGRKIVEAEAGLDTGFASGSISPESLAKQTREIGLLKGELRAAHLKAHLETRAVLTEEQVARYIELRGYKKGGRHHGRS